jgi:hypothetical protein
MVLLDLARGTGDEGAYCKLTNQDAKDRISEISARCDQQPTVRC